MHAHLHSWWAEMREPSAVKPTMSDCRQQAGWNAHARMSKSLSSARSCTACSTGGGRKLTSRSRPLSWSWWAARRIFMSSSRRSSIALADDKKAEAKMMTTSTITITASSQCQSGLVMPSYATAAH